MPKVIPEQPCLKRLAIQVEDHALDTDRMLKSRATKADLLTARQGHTLAEASLMGVYERRR